jgi:hypothetical protein
MQQTTNLMYLHGSDTLLDKNRLSVFEVIDSQSHESFYFILDNFRPLLPNASNVQDSCVAGSHYWCVFDSDLHYSYLTGTLRYNTINLSVWELSKEMM